MRLIVFLLCLGALKVSGQTTYMIGESYPSVVYWGMDNYFSVLVPGYTSDEVRLDCLNCKSLEKKNGKYILQPAETDRVEVHIYSLKKKNKDKLLGTHLFRAKPLPNPIVKFAGYKSGDTLSKKLFLSAGALTGYIPEIEPCAHPIIASFSLGFYTEDCQWYEKTISGNACSPALMDEIRPLLVPGKPVHIDRVHARMPDGTVRVISLLYHIR